MRTIATVLALLLASLTLLGVGADPEDRRIVASCVAKTDWTMIKGHKYLCLTEEVVREISNPGSPT